MNSISRSIYARSLMTGAALLAFMMASAGAVRAQTVIGANGGNGSDCFTDGCHAGNAINGDPAVSDGNVAAAFGGAGGVGGKSFGDDGHGGNGGFGGPASASGADATAVGGAGGGAGDFPSVGFPGLGGDGGDATAASSNDGSSAATATAGAGGRGIVQAIFLTNGGSGGNATATSSATASGSTNATSSATATGGGPGGDLANAGNAIATSSATASGSGSATASATATQGFAFGEFGNNIPTISATANAETANGRLAQAQAVTQAATGPSDGDSQATAKTTFGGVSVQSAVQSAPLPFDGLTEAIAQGGSGQSPVDPDPERHDGFAFSTALPNAAYATTLIGSASNVANALLGPGDIIFGTAILGGPDSSATFDFSFRGDLILGVITDGGFDIVVNGTDIPFEDGGDNSVINLGSLFGPKIDLTIEGDGVFAVGGAVPEPSTWAMMLIGFAGLGYASYRSARRTAAVSPQP
jgi:hypothetical protein